MQSIHSIEDRGLLLTRKRLPGNGSIENCPQELKPLSIWITYGTAKAVPLTKPKLTHYPPAGAFFCL
jgi:hypothetical protein